MFAKALATAVMASLVSSSQLNAFTTTAKRLTHSQFAAVGSQVQPRRALPELVPEFAFLLVLKGLPQTDVFALDNKSVLQSCVTIQYGHDAPVHIPCGSKPLRLTIRKGGDRQFSWERVAVHSLQDVADRSKAGGDLQSVTTPYACSCSSDSCSLTIPASMPEVTEERVFGVRWTPAQFLERASLVKHPLDAISGVDDELASVCNLLATSDPNEIKIQRCKVLGKWMAKIKELGEEEQKIKTSMSAERMKIMQTKKASADEMDHC